VLNNFKPNKSKMLKLANKGFITATDLADYLVKYHKKSFRKAYQITASVVNYAEKNKIKLNELSLKELQKIEPSLKSNVLNIFDLKSSVNSKKSFGGTSFNNIKKMIVKYNKIYK
jgi:argininosuccinate lyase